MPPLTIVPGERIAVIGPNGSGKSTLLHTLAGDLPPLDGTLTLGPRSVRRLYRQDLGQSIEHGAADVPAGEDDRTVLADLLATHPVGEERARTLLGSLLFSGDDTLKLVGDLSGGERARLMMGKLAIEETNLLLLDEPTNHLDIPAQEVLEARARQVPGRDGAGDPRPRAHRRRRHTNVGDRGRRDPRGARRLLGAAEGTGSRAPQVSVVVARSRTPSPGWALVAATVAVSFSAILIKAAGDDAATIVWLRMGMAAVLLAPWVLRDARRGVLPQRADADRPGGGERRVPGRALPALDRVTQVHVGRSQRAARLAAPDHRDAPRETPAGRTCFPSDARGGGLAIIGTIVTCAGDLRVEQQRIRW